MPEAKKIQRTIIALSAVLLCAAALAIGQAQRRTVGTAPGSIEVDGLERTYLLHLPPGYGRSRKTPLVLVLHGAIQSPASIERMSGMSALSDQEKFLVAYPSGTGRLSNVPTWNAGTCCGYALAHQVDDVAFLRALIDKLERDYPVDPQRVYVTGISNGAMMSYRLACELANKIAAIAPVEGALNVDCRPTHPVSAIIFHGTADRLVPFDAAPDAAAFWVKQDGCASDPARDQTPEVHTAIYSGCRNGAGVALYAIQGGRHIWPGHPFSGNHVPATKLMWSFFVQHPKP